MRRLFIIAALGLAIGALCTSCVQKVVRSDRHTGSTMDSIVYSIYVVAPRSAVWKAIVTPEEASKYYMAKLTEIDLRPGGTVNYNNCIFGEIVEIKTEEALKHTFAFGPGDPRSTVLYTLDRVGDNVTQVTVIHTDFHGDDQMAQDVAAGWPVILSSMKSYLETGSPIEWPKP